MITVLERLVRAALSGVRTPWPAVERRLPEPPADPAALFDVERAFWFSLTLGAIALLAFAAVLWSNRRRPVQPADAGAPLPGPRGGDDDLASRVRRLELQAAASGDYRTGCHRLARLVREQLRQRLGLPQAVARTAQELAALEPDAGVDELLFALRERRFGRRAPRRHEFQDLCRRTVRTLDAAGGRES
ncbi:MAG: hypothetical protein DWQ36_07400 [Acidobacteria bacterium]|nr:MAG: hypothetical protein DWQ30_11915 [Acidobacteriota bacterium]REK09143.1 MAG: hypothetical protein DWQ36_07400 [Acidobacteriota bacterium]